MPRIKVLILLLFTAAIIAFYTIGREPGYKVSAQTAGEKTAGETHPNVKLLKDLPESQLQITMNFMRASLGVSCAYCHVVSPEGKWDFSKDDKPLKETARKHIQMTMDLNKANFGGRPVITCNTCHQGQTKPIALPALPQAQPEGGPAGMKPEVVLPSIDQVLNKYVQAIGGRAALEKIKSRVTKGSQTGFDGTALPLEIYSEAPDRFLFQVTRPQGLVLQGYNGTGGWIKNPRGQRELSGDELALMKRRALFNAGLKLKELYPDLKITAKENAGGREAFVAESELGKNATLRLFFDAASGLLIRQQIISKNTLTPIPEQVDYEDYREVDGVKLPFTIRQSFVDPWIGWTQKFTEIKQNVPVESTKFDPPK
jgi:hypothetical protein